jgi:hypothetical protein
MGVSVFNVNLNNKKFFCTNSSKKNMPINRTTKPFIENLKIFYCPLEDNKTRFSPLQMRGYFNFGMKKEI